MFRKNLNRQISRIIVDKEDFFCYNNQLPRHQPSLPSKTLKLHNEGGFILYMKAVFSSLQSVVAEKGMETHKGFGEPYPKPQQRSFTVI